MTSMMIPKTNSAIVVRIHRAASAANESRINKPLVQYSFDLYSS